MKRDSSVKKEKKAKNVVASKSTSSFWGFAATNSKIIFRIFIFVVAAIFASVVWRSTSAGVKNIMNADADVLKSVLTGDLPYLYYCHRGGKQETVPSYFSDLNMIKGSKMGFAIVNCSQVLPSGKTMWDKFKLKKEWRPVIFGTAPWLKPLQASPTYLKDVKTLTTFVDTSMAPKATEIRSDKELTSFCGFGKSKSDDPYATLPTCFVLLKGSKFSKVHNDLEQRLVKENPRVKFALVDATKKRLSIEGSELISPDLFALKAFALRNGTFYTPMVMPITWDYLSTFVLNSVAAPLKDYSHDKGKPIKLIKASSSGFKDRSAPKASAGTGSDQQDSSSSTKKSRKSKKSGSKKSDGETTSSEARQQGVEKEKEKDAPPAVPPKELTEAERIAKERARREEMERLARENMIEEGGDGDSADNDDDGDEDDDDEEEEVVEL